MANGHGGRRQGSGRKKGSIKQFTQRHANALSKATAEQILGVADEFGLWARALHSKHDDVALKALIYLSNKRDGVPFRQPSPTGPGKTNPADDPRFTALMDKIKQSAKLTLTQTTVTAENAGQLPAPTSPVIEAQLT